MSTTEFTTPNPELAPLYAKLPPVYKTTAENIVEGRERMRKFIMPLLHSREAPYLPAETTYKVTDMTVPFDDHEIPIRCYTPTGDEGKKFPLLLWSRGSAFVLGDLDFDDPWLKTVCVETQMVVINIGYRLAPEHPHPAGLNDVYAVVLWASQQQNVAALNADLALGFILGGQSAGANFIAVCAHRVKNDAKFSGVRPTGQALMVPTVLHPNAEPPEEYKAKMTSRVDCANAPLFNTDRAKEYFDLLNAPPTSTDISPFLHPSLAGLPPTFFQVCGLDPLRDEGRVYAERMEAVGIPIKINLYPGCVHGFHQFFRNTDVAQTFDTEFKAGLRWLLSVKPDVPRRHSGGGWMARGVRSVQERVRKLVHPRAGG